MTTYHLDPASALGDLRLTVRNLDRALTLYRDVLGLTAQREEARTIALSVGDEPPLLTLTEDPVAPSRPPRSPGLYHMAILLPSRTDLARILLRLSEARYPVQGASDHGVSEALYLADPEGNGIEIYRDRPRDEWPIEDGVMKMVTDALDVDGVLSTIAGSTAHGSGLAPGTRIGHIHLQVSDLPSAEEFYLNALGFDLMQRYGPSASFLSVGGYHHHVGINTWASAGSPPAPPESLGLKHFTIVLPSRRALEKLTEHLKEMDIPMERNDAAVLVRDPSQNAVLLTVSRGRGESIARTGKGKAT